jgi:hypothetical protein
MPIEFNCPNCFKSYRVADDNAGRRSKCKDCGAAMTVPDKSGLSLADEETGQHRRPAKRHSSTKILPANRPSGPSTKGPLKSMSAGVQIKRNIPSDTARLDTKPATTSRTKSATKAPATPPEPEPAPSRLPPGKLPGGLKSPGDLPKLKPAAGKTRSLPPEAPKKRMVNLVLLLGAAALIVGFFLPWFTLQVKGFSDPVAGFQVPLLAPDFASALDAAGYGENPVVAALVASKVEIFVLFALYLIPLVALYGVINDIRCAGKGKSHWWTRILVFLFPAVVGAAVYFMFRAAFDAWLAQGGPGALDIEPTEALGAIGPGTWVFLGGWFLTLLAIVIAPKVKKPAAAPLPQSADADTEEDDVPDVSAHTRPRLPQSRSTRTG